MPAILGALVTLLIQALRQYLPGIVGRILLALGIGFATHTIAMPALKAFIQSKVAGLPGVLYAYFEATGFGVFTTMVLSAYLAVHAQKAILSKISGD